MLSSFMRKLYNMSCLELMIVIAVVGIIATATIPPVVAARERKADERAQRALRQIQAAQHEYYSVYSRYGEASELCGQGLLDEQFQKDPAQLGYGVEVEVIISSGGQVFEATATTGTSEFQMNMDGKIVEEAH